MFQSVLDFIMIFFNSDSDPRGGSSFIEACMALNIATFIWAHHQKKLQLFLDSTEKDLSEMKPSSEGVTSKQDERWRKKLDSAINLGLFCFIVLKFLAKLGVKLAIFSVILGFAFLFWNIHGVGTSILLAPIIFMLPAYPLCGIVRYRVKKLKAKKEKEEQIIKDANTPVEEVSAEDVESELGKTADSWEEDYKTDENKNLDTKINRHTIIETLTRGKWIFACGRVMDFSKDGFVNRSWVNLSINWTLDDDIIKVQKKQFRITKDGKQIVEITGFEFKKPGTLIIEETDKP